MLGVCGELAEAIDAKVIEYKNRWFPEEVEGSIPTAEDKNAASIAVTSDEGKNSSLPSPIAAYGKVVNPNPPVDPNKPVVEPSKPTVEPVVVVDTKPLDAKLKYDRKAKLPNGAVQYDYNMNVALIKEKELKGNSHSSGKRRK